jgi:hypothetical protein
MSNRTNRWNNNSRTHVDLTQNLLSSRAHILRVSGVDVPRLRVARIPFRDWRRVGSRIRVLECYSGFAPGMSGGSEYYIGVED